MRKGEQKKQDILSAAADLFAHKGYVSTSVQDILDRLNCSKGSFYHHFNTKFEVLAEIAQARAAAAYLNFKESEPAGALAALNELLYQASYLNPESLPLLKDLNALQSGFEGTALLHAMQESVHKTFYPSFVVVMNSLRQTDEAVYTDESALHIVFNSFLSGCSLLIAKSRGHAPNKEPADGLTLLRALRRHLEISLGMNPGSIVIISSDALGSLLDSLQRISANS